jgi:hypothetical protein
MSAHTQGRLVVAPYEGFGPLTTIRAGDPKTGTRIASTFEATNPAHIERNEANARRLVACWNACDGVPIEVLEAGQAGGLPWSVAEQIEQRVQRTALLDALSTLVNHCERMGFNTREEVPLLEAARAAITKTEPA